MVRDHALRITGGAAGVADRNRVPFIGRAFEPRQRRVHGEQRFVFVRADALARTSEFAVADVNDDRLAAMFGLQQTQRLLHHRRKLSVGDQHVSLAVVHLPGQQRRVEACVECVQHRVQRRHRIVRFDHLRCIRQHDADGAAAANAERTQSRGQPCTAIAGLRPVVAPLAVHHCGQVGKNLGTALNKAHRR